METPYLWPDNLLCCELGRLQLALRYEHRVDFSGCVRRCLQTTAGEDTGERVVPLTGPSSETAIIDLCLAYISQQRFLYGNTTRQMLSYRVHCATKVFDARTLHNKSFNAAILAEHIKKAARCDWLLATTNNEFACTLHNKCF